MHRFIPDPSEQSPATFLDPSQSAAIKTIVRELLRLPPDTPVTISEIACADAGCPLLETVIAVFPEGASSRCWKLVRPRAALTRLMLRQTLATPHATAGAGSALDAPVNLAP